MRLLDAPDSRHPPLQRLVRDQLPIPRAVQGGTRPLLHRHVVVIRGRAEEFRSRADDVHHWMQPDRRAHHAAPARIEGAQNVVLGLRRRRRREEKGILESNPGERDRTVRHGIPPQLIQLTPASLFHLVVIFFACVQNSIDPLPGMSPTPKRDSFQPPNENGSRGTGTPTFTPTIPALAFSMTYRATPPLSVNTDAAFPYRDAFSMEIACSTSFPRTITSTGPNTSSGAIRMSAVT